MIKDNGDSGKTNVSGDKASVPERKRKATSEKRFRARREALEHVAVRIPVKDVARIDALAVKYATVWFKPTRSDMMRKLLLKALDGEDAAATDAAADEEPTEDDDEDEE
jgi:hypothetical protein